MFVQLFNPQSGRRARMDSQALGKVLHLATFHGWKPERIDWLAPSASWDTQIIVPYLSPYLSGVVSDSDAARLVVALKRVLASEGAGLASDIYLTVLGLTAIAEGSGFALNPEVAPAETNSSPSSPRREVVAAVSAPGPKPTTRDPDLERRKGDSNPIPD